MRAVSYPAYGVAPTLGELPDPSCPDGGVLVRVEATGVCRSDWHAWRGHDPVPLPMVPGHEFAGTVAAVGEGVRRWRVGDRVTVPFACGCGECEVCRVGDTHVCPRQTQPGFTGWGSFAELVAVHAAAANVVALPECVDEVAADALGCRFATAYRAVVSVGRLAPGEWLAVHGCGGVGPVSYTHLDVYKRQDPASGRHTPICFYCSDIGGHDEGVGSQLAGQHGRGEVLVDDGFDAAQDIGRSSLATEHRRDAAAACADDDAAGAQQQIDGPDLEDPQRPWRRHDPPPMGTCLLYTSRCV